MKTQLETLTTRGLRTAWLQSGSAENPILLMLHGFPDGPEIWDLMAEAFSDRFQVIRPYGRGTAHSEPADGIHRYSTASESLDLFSVLKAVDPLGRRKVVVIGHDLGGVLAWAFGHHLGSRLAGLVLFNSLSLQQAIAKLRDPRQLLRSWYVYMMQLPALPEFITSKLPQIVQNLAYSRGGLPVKSHPDVEKLAANAQHAVNRYRALIREGAASDNGSKSRIKQPVMMIHGTKDPFVIPPTQDEIEPFAVNPEIRILEAGHWPFLESSEIVHSLLDRFFARLSLDARERTAAAFQDFLASSIEEHRPRSL